MSDCYAITCKTCRQLASGQIIEFVSSDGKVKGPAKIVTGRVGVVITLRELYWHERAWRRIVMRCRTMRDWMRSRVASYFAA